MSVFLSWSGKGSRSHRVAEVLRTFVPRIIQRAECFMSSQDIEAGGTWLTEILQKLEVCNVGIICVSAEAIQRPWINFEAGALAKKLGVSRVCPLLIGIAEREVGFPLAAFQMKTTEKTDLFSVFTMINKAQGENHLSEGTLADAFGVWWPKIEAELASILAEPESNPRAVSQRTDSEIMAEILGLVRGIHSAVGSQGESLKTPPDPIEGGTVFQYLCKETRRRRPLIAMWVEAGLGATIEGDELVIRFPAEHALAVEFIQQKNNRDFLEGLLTELHPNRNLKLSPRLQKKVSGAAK